MKLRLLTKMIVFILVPSMFGLLLLSGVSGYVARTGMHGQIDDAMTQMVQRQSGEMQNIANLMAESMKNFAGEDSVLDFLEAIADEQSEAVVSALRNAVDHRITNMHNAYSTMSQIGVITPKGLIVAHITPRSVGTTRAYFSPDDKPYVISTRSGTTGEVTAVFTVPVYRDGRLLGHVYTTTAMKALAEKTIGTIKLYDSGTACMYDAKGMVLMHSDASRQGADDGGNAWVRDMLSQKSGKLIRQDAQSGQHMMFFSTLPRLGWTIAFDVPAAEADAPLMVMIKIIALIASLMLLGGGAIVFWIARSTASGVRDLTDFSAYVAEGNLEVLPEQRQMLDKYSRRTDELGDLSQSISIMTRNMADTVKHAESKTAEAEAAAAEARVATARAEEASREAAQALRKGRLEAAEHLEGVVESITSALTQLSAQIEQSERGAEDQAARMGETATAMEEMNSTVLEVAKNAGTAAETSALTGKKAQDGAGVVNHTLQGIQQVQEKSESLQRNVQELSGHAQTIGHIMSVISDIADQTNLLALNAAIEAARAGEAGRGFAVVADEVRKLAEKTMISTTDVGNAIRTIQESTAASAHELEEVMLVIQQATEAAGASGTSLKTIVNMVDQTADQVRAIATASEQQSATSEEINHAITGVNNIAEQTASAMREASAAMNDLARQTQILGDLIKQLKEG